MTLNELITLVGGAWSRLLLYPAGLAAFAAAWLIAFISSPQTQSEDREWRIADSGSFTSGAIRYPLSSIFHRWLWAISVIALPWLGLALLPLPPAPGLSRQADVVVVLALLEWPRVLAIVCDIRQDGDRWLAGLRRLAAALNSYPPLILAQLALAQAAASFDVAALARLPGEFAPPFARPLHWAGAVAWLLALPPLLNIGPFRADVPYSYVLGHSDRAGAGSAPRGRNLLRRAANAARSLLNAPLRTALRLRALGLILLAALPWMAAFGALEEGGLSAPAGLAAWLLSPALIAALAWGYDRLTAGRAPRRWARLYLALDVALLLALLWAAFVALQARLT